MKCIQKLCQRTKNITSTGNYNVCDEVIKQNTEKRKRVDKQNKIIEKVEVDLTMKISTHKKLANGQKVDPEIVSNLLLGGIINILAQHDTIASIEEKLKIVQHEINKQHKN